MLLHSGCNFLIKAFIVLLKTCVKKIYLDILKINIEKNENLYFVGIYHNFNIAQSL